MSSCTSCGHQLGVGRFCTNCGAPVDSATPDGTPDGTDTAPRTPRLRPATTGAPTPPSGRCPRPRPTREPLRPRWRHPRRPATRCSRTRSRGTRRTARSPRPPPSRPRSRRSPPPEDPTEPEPEAYEYDYVYDEERRSPVLWILAAALVLVLVTAGWWFLVRDDGSDPAADDDGNAQSAQASETGGADGVDVAGQASAKAPRTAPPNEDVNGDQVSYDASNMLDGVHDTAWRASGDGTGLKLTFTLREPAELHQVGLINGYAKTSTDDKGRTFDWYLGNRRIEAVTWIFDDGSKVRQELDRDPRGAAGRRPRRRHRESRAQDHAGLPAGRGQGRPRLHRDQRGLHGRGRDGLIGHSRESTAAAASASALGHVEVGDHPDGGRADGRDPDALLGGRRDERRRVAALDHDDVGVDRGRVDAAGLGKQLRVGVVLGQPLDVVVEGVQPGGGQDADLPHAAAHPLAAHPRLVDRVPRARPSASRSVRPAPWTGTPTGRTRWRRTRRAGRRWPRARSRSAPRRGALPAPTPVAQARELLQLVERQHRAAGEVVGVLDRDRRGRARRTDPCRARTSTGSRAGPGGPAGASRCAS